MSKKKKLSTKNTEYRYSMDDEKSIFEEILSFLGTFLICSILIILVSSLLFKPNVVSGRSMYPTLQTDDRGLSNVFALFSQGIQRGDIVTANMVNDEDGQTYSVIKRVIGLPGETIECKDEVIYINGEALDESAWMDEEYIEEWKSANGYFNYDFDPVTLEEDEYFLIGDNRPISKDSRDVGPIKKSEILAKDFLLLFPFDRLAYLT